MCSLANSDLMFEPDEDSSVSSSDECSTSNASEISTICKKCREAEAAVTLRGKDRYCRECFLANVTHKFRSTLGKNRAIRHGEKIGIDFDGGQNSVALLKLIDSSLDEKNVKRVDYTPVLIVICEDGERAQKIIKLGQTFGHSIFVVPLEDCFSCDEIKPLTVEEFSSRKPCSDEFVRYVKEIQDGSSREFFIENFRQRALLKTAQLLNCTKIFTSDISNTLAVKLISGIACGRGSHLVEDVGFSGPVSDDGVQLLRPLKDFSVEEIAVYNNGDDAILPPAETESSTDSIQTLTRKFVFGLQEGFPATIPTICKTGDKISRPEVANETDNCSLCGGNLDTSSTDKSCTALDATEFSRKISMAGSNSSAENSLNSQLNKLKMSELESQGKGCTGSGECSSGQNESCCQDRQEIEISIEGANRFLCYGCRVVANRLPELPEFVRKDVRKRLARQRLRDEIEDFLL